MKTDLLVFLGLALGLGLGTAAFAATAEVTTGKTVPAATDLASGVPVTSVAQTRCLPPLVVR